MFMPICLSFLTKIKLEIEKHSYLHFTFVALLGLIN